MFTGILIIMLVFIAIRFLRAVIRTVWYGMVSMMWFAIACVIAIFLLFGH